MKNQKRKKLSLPECVLCLLYVFIVIMLISVFFTGKPSSKKCCNNSNYKNAENSEVLPNALLFRKGTYECGKDFKEGTYNITAASGQGLLYCDGKIKLLMGTTDIDKYQVNCSGVYFNKNEIIHITNDLVLIMIKTE